MAIKISGTTVIDDNRSDVASREKLVVVTDNNIDLSLGNYFTKTITTVTNFTISNVSSSGTANCFFLILTNGGTKFISWFNNVRWQNNTAPSLSIDGKTDVLAFFTHDGGRNWNGVLLSSGVTPSSDVYVANVASLFDIATVNAWKFNALTGFGTKFSNPTSLPNQDDCYGITFSPSRKIVVAGELSSPFIHAWKFSSTGFGTKYSNPTTLPTGGIRNIRFNSSESIIGFAHDSSPFITVYQWLGTTYPELSFGTKYSNPASPIQGNATSLDFSPPMGNSIAVGHNSSPFISAYKFDNISGFGVKYSNPFPLPPGAVYSTSFSPNGDCIAVGHSNSPYISVYKWNSSTGFGTKYANPSTLPASIGEGIAFSPSGDAIAVAHAFSPYITVYPWNSSTGFGTKYANPALTPGSDCNGVGFSPFGDAIIVSRLVGGVCAYTWNSKTGFTSSRLVPGTNSDYSFNCAVA